MNSEQLTAAAQSVIQLSAYLEDLKSQALAMFDPAAVRSRGYITPSEETRVRQLQFSYWKARNALYEVVYDVWNEVEAFERATPPQFLVAFAAAAVLVDAARFLRENFHRVDVVRRKLDEPDAIHGIPPRMYDDVQKSLTSPYHALRLWQATRYYDKHHAEFQQAAEAEGLLPLLAIIDARRDRLRPSLGMYVRTRLRVRGRRIARHIGRDFLGRGVYVIQEAVGRGMAEVRVRPGHSPSLPRSIRGQLVALLQPGDVLVVRKEFAATNYFLPGYWPHAALYLGRASDLTRLGLAEQEPLRPRVAQLNAADARTACLKPHEAESWSEAGEHPCVLESMKDGVRIRSINSPFSSDSAVVLRPRLETAQIAEALAHALIHEGKAYDFDFDFSVSHRLVCTEVVYRAFEGVGAVQFELQRHVGRFALGASELLRMAIAGAHFDIVAVYATRHSPQVELGPAAAEIVRRVEGLPR